MVLGSLSQVFSQGGVSWLGQKWVDEKARGLELPAVISRVLPRSPIFSYLSCSRFVHPHKLRAWNGLDVGKIDSKVLVKYTRTHLHVYTHVVRSTMRVFLPIRPMHIEPLGYCASPHWNTISVELCTKYPQSVYTFTFIYLSPRLSVCLSVIFLTRFSYRLLGPKHASFLSHLTAQGSSLAVLGFSLSTTGFSLHLLC